jgi:tRNA(Ile)-lysidine synthase
MKILAVSGGIDSMVMLHFFRKEKDIIVAHFDHGIRPNSKIDAEFVKNTAKKYGLKCVIKREELGAECSEAFARERRYIFLKELAVRHQAKIYTAHHSDDLLESIAINIIRGTGWRGLVPFRDAQIERPLLNWFKKDIYLYAAKNEIVFRQDQTNTDDKYLRNRIRFEFTKLTDAQKQEIVELYLKQKALSEEIDQIADQLVLKNIENDNIERKIFQEVDDIVAIELLRRTLSRYGCDLTYPQLHLALDAMRHYHKGKKFNLPRDRFIVFSRKHCKIST